jgi:hypothetical protein
MNGLLCGIGQNFGRSGATPRPARNQASKGFLVLFFKKEHASFIA